MRRFPAMIGLVLAVSAAPLPAFARADALEARIATAWAAAETVAVRKDVQEVTLPPPPSGPATPTPFCTPSAPICP